MKKIITVILSIMLLALICLPIAAEEQKLSYYYDTTSDGLEVVVYRYTASDALRILRVLAKLETGHFNNLYDVNADGEITMEDAVLALKSAAGLIKIQFPNAQPMPE